MSGEEPIDHDDGKERSVTAVWTDAFRKILDTVPGEDSNREGLIDTPGRAANAMASFTQGYQQTAWEIVGDAVFQSGSNERVLVKNIDLYSLCEHHVVPFFGKVHVAFLPKNGRVVGLSKIPRLVNIFAQRLQLQERLTTEIGKALQEVLEPRGVAVIMECRHMCMEMRGVAKTGASTWTQFRSGLFDNDQEYYWREFKMDVYGPTTIDVADHRRYPCFASPVATPRRQFIAPSIGNCNPSKVKGVDIQPALAKKLRASMVLTEAETYRLYQSCAKDEFEVMATIIVESMRGPSLREKQGLSVLDIGAGNGRLIETLVSKRRIDKYSGFEQDDSLCAELKDAISNLSFNEESCIVRNETFSTETSIEHAGGRADVVLLSHCLYYSRSKESMVHHALKFVAPGGILFIFHQWNSKDVLDDLSRELYSANVLHHLHVFEITLNVKHLSCEERFCVSKYANTAISDQCASVTARHGCLTIEQFSDDKVSRKVSYEARRKSPVANISPQTIVGIQSCLRAASLGVMDCQKVSVVGGGHSANCHADNAIAIDMHRWDDVVVDKSTGTVRVGGGATIGAITTECEKHGLVVPLGDRPSVGMGLVLQGGLNHLMRCYGLACDNILRVEYVAPSGEYIVARTAEQLFPFRGAGPSFGVVTEVTLRTQKLESILTQTTDYLLVDHQGFQSQALSQFSDVATKLPNSISLDGFLYWSSHDQLVFATTSFDTDKQHGPSNIPGIADILSTSSYRNKVQEGPTWCKASQLFDRELYMTERFHPSRTVLPEEVLPTKLRSLKRCLLFPPLHAGSGSALLEVVRSPPTKWSYIHFLQGGGAAGTVNRSESAFGCRDWAFAVVITGRYPDGDETLENATVCWLEAAGKILMPFTVGVYGADLGPADFRLAQSAFGDNGQLLAKMKRLQDPLNILSCGCPLVPEDNAASFNDLRYNEGAGVIILFCGRRFAGKDWLAEVVQHSLAGLLGNQGADSKKVSISRISDTTKRLYAAENPGVDFERLIHDREYKESHRVSLTKYYQAQKANNVTFDAQCFMKEIEHSQADILLLTGMRDGLSYAKRLAGRPVVLVRVDASTKARELRGWVSDPAVDESPGECSADYQVSSWWDCIYNNDVESTVSVAIDWATTVLAPAVLKQCVRLLPDTPQPGVVFKDLVGGILAQPFALRLTCSLIGQLTNREDETQIDVIAVPEATGFLFAAPVAAQLQVPLVALRKPGKLPGDVSLVQYKGSNIDNLRIASSRDASSSLELINGSIQHGQHVLIIDDCLASGATAEAIVRLIRQKGAFVKRFACVMELSDLHGRESLNKLGVEVFSLMQFCGK